MIVTINNFNYSIDRGSTIESLLTRMDIQRLPLKDWYTLLFQKNGMVSPKHLRKVLINKINEYDTSEKVNSFIIDNNPFWLDKNTRVGLMHLANCS
jgi:intergrase/recombinase